MFPFFIILLDLKTRIEKIIYNIDNKTFYYKISNFMHNSMLLIKYIRREKYE